MGRSCCCPAVSTESLVDVAHPQLCRVAPRRGSRMSADVLVLRPLGLGDLLTAVPALLAVRRALPTHRLVFGAPAASGSIAARAACVDAGVHTSDDDRALAVDDLGPVADVSSDGRGVTIVHPGASAGSRRWPPDRWAEVARSLTRDGHRVVVTGGRGERALAAGVAKLAGLPESAVLA